MKNSFYVSMVGIALTLVTLTACGDPALVDYAGAIDPIAANGEVTAGSLPSGIGDFIVSSESSYFAYSNNVVKSNIHYDTTADILSITLFGNDTSNTWNGTMYMTLANISQKTTGTSLNIADSAATGIYAIRAADINSATPSETITVEDGAVTPTAICLADYSCTNAGSFTFTYTSSELDSDGNPITVTISGNYMSPSLYLD